MTDVSVVVPTRNRADLLPLTVRSALGQRNVDLELVVVDDGSDDDTVRLVTHVDDPRVRLVRHERPCGVSAARNSGIAAARGRWVALLDDDDVWAPDKLPSQLAAAADAGAGWVYAGDVAVDEGLRILGGGPPPAPARVLAELRRYNAVPGSASSVAVAADVLARAGGFDPGLRRAEDWDMWLRLARHGTPAAVARPLVAIRQHLANVIVDRDSLIEEPAILARRHRIPIDPLAARRRAAWGLLRAGRRMAAAREYVGLAARGDLRSLGRAVVALAHPAVGTYRMFSLAGMPQDPDWAQQARAWLEPLAERRAP